MIRAAVCGLGIGMAHCAGYRAGNGVELVAVADLLPERRGTVGGTFAAGSMLVLRPLYREEELGLQWEEIGVTPRETLDELLADPSIDLVSLCTPDYLHAQQAIQVLEAGKHLLLEKPVALTLPDARRVQDAAAKAEAQGIMCTVGYEFRLNPAILKMRALVEAGEVGHVEAFSLYHFRTPFRRDKWQHWIQKRALSGGLIVEETSHWLDLARYITGKEVSSIHCVTTDRIHADFDFEDVAYINGTYVDGAVFQISHALTGFDFDLTLVVHGTKGTVWCGLKETRSRALDAGQTTYLGVVSWGNPGEGVEGARTVTYGEEATEPENIRDFAHHFAHCVAAQRPPVVGVLDGVRALELALAAGHSARFNRVISMAEDLEKYGNT